MLNVKSNWLRLTQREIELLEFVLDQKFVELHTLYLRFYKGEGSKNSRYAYRRLRLLTNHGFLRVKRIYTKPGNIYLATSLAHTVVQNQNPERTVSLPSAEVDLRTFEHDRRVTICRAVREKNLEVKEWLSERRLKQEWTKNNGYNLSRQYMPDAIFTSRNGGRVAFELELAPKTRERYAKKVSKFLDIMTSHEGPFKRALFVACSESVFQTLLTVTRPYPEFLVSRYEDVVLPAPASKESGN